MVTIVLPTQFNLTNSTFIFDAHVKVVVTHLPVAAIAPISLAAAESLSAAPGTSSLRLAAAPPAVLSKVLVCRCTFGYGHVAVAPLSAYILAVIGQFGRAPIIS